MNRFLPALLVLFLTSANAQVVVADMAEGMGCTLYAEAGEAVAGPYLRPELITAARLGAATRVTTHRSATITIDYTGFTPAAQAAFQRAVEIWADHITSPIEIRVKASFGPLDTNVLGSAGPTTFLKLISGATQTWYPLALADKLLGRDYSGSGGTIPYDINAVFSSSFDRFYFGLDGNPGPTQFDFVTVVLHELGHGLGFLGTADVDDGAGTGNSIECNGTAGVGCFGITVGNPPDTDPLIYDRFIEDEAGISILMAGIYANPGPELGALFQSQNLFVDAPEVVRIYGQRPPIYAPTTFESGSSYSHWDEATIRNSSAALMTPAVAPGEAYQDPGNITCAFFKDMGWDLGTGCQLLTTATEVGPNDTSLALDLDGPNPVRHRTALRLRQSEPGPVTVVLYDVLGRRLATLLHESLGTEATMDVDAARLAPGVYRILAQTARGSRALSLTVVR